MFTLKLIGTVLYGLLSLGGGILGYWKSKSKVSLISGGISGLLLLILGVFIYSGIKWAEIVAAAIVASLIVVFSIRWFKTKKFMPAMPMILLGVISFIFILSRSRRYF